MNRTTRLFLLTAFAALAAGLLLAGCNYVSPSITHRPKVYSDAPVDLSELMISVKPKGKQKMPLKALVYPFWITQDIKDNTDLGLQFAQIFHSVWLSHELFPVQVLDSSLVYRSPEKAVAEARKRGADVVVVGLVPYIYAGQTLDDSAITLQINIYETGQGNMIWSMAQSARLEYNAPQDWILADTVTRMPDSPIRAAILAIAEDMAVPMDSWLPDPDANLGYASTSESITDGLTRSAPAGGMQSSDLPEALAAPGSSINIHVEFDTDKATIRPEYHPYLDELGRALTGPELAGKTIGLAGHTDSSAEPEYNLTLSEKRAESVKAYLVQKFGIDPARIVTRGYGESRPLVPNDSPENMQKNRRVEVWIVG